jgi:hypothetical protein
MSERQGRTTDNNGRHYDFIKSRIPPAIQTASLQRIQALDAVKKGPSRWITTASNYNHNRLQNANLKLWATHNKVDRLLDQLQNIYQFAEPLLSAALKEQFGVDHDVRTIYLHLYLPKERPWYAINISGGFITRTVSLLDAALHNFALGETCEADSDFISQPDERGLFDIKPIKRKMSIAEFQALCRELDIGARYTEHLESFLLPGDPVAETYLKNKVVDSQKAAFTAAAQQAVMTGDIERDTLHLVLAMLDGQRNLTFKGKTVQFGELSIMGTALTGIVFISPDLERAREAAPIIAYLPHDPEHPLKEYPSVTDFLNELTRQLRDNHLIPSSGMTYRQYFSQFVDHPQRGVFFAGLQQRLFKIQWHKKEPLDQRPTWREEPVPTPHLQFSVTPVNGELWDHLYQNKLNKILNDVKHIAVSTADTDSNARWAWWDNFKKIASDIFNVALMVLTPFVPGLGELMMAYPAQQAPVQALRNRLVDLANTLEPDIFNQLYRAAETSDTPSVRLLCTTFPDLPGNVAQTLLTRASAAELERMTDHQQIPLRLKSLAREAAFEAQTNHAYEGFHDDAQMVADTERLVLNTLRIFTDSFSDLRIEVYDGTYDGDLRCSVGNEDASTLRKLIREQPGQYAVHDGSNTPLHQADDFYEALLNALPADKRARLGYRPGQGAQFKQWVMVQTEAPAERRTVLAEPPIRSTPDLQTERLSASWHRCRTGACVGSSRGPRRCLRCCLHCETPGH